MITNLKKKKERKNMEKEEEKYNTSTLTKGKTPWSSKSFLVLNMIFL